MLAVAQLERWTGPPGVLRKPQASREDLASAGSKSTNSHSQPGARASLDRAADDRDAEALPLVRGSGLRVGAVLSPLSSRVPLNVFCMPTD